MSTKREEIILKISFLWIYLMKSLNAKSFIAFDGTTTIAAAEAKVMPTSFLDYNKYEQYYHEQQQQQHKQQQQEEKEEDERQKQQHKQLSVEPFTFKEQQQQKEQFNITTTVLPIQNLQIAQSFIFPDEHDFYSSEIRRSSDSDNIMQQQQNSRRKHRRRPQIKLSATTTTNTHIQNYWHKQMLENITEQTSNDENEYSSKKSRKPFETLKAHESEIETTAIDLKSLLKKSSGSISLSEILQRKNLTLDDLIKGKRYALQILQSTVEPKRQNENSINREKEYNDNIADREEQSDTVIDKRPLIVKSLSIKQQKNDERAIASGYRFVKITKPTTISPPVFALNYQDSDEEDNSLERLENRYDLKPVTPKDNDSQEEDISQNAEENMENLSDEIKDEKFTNAIISNAITRIFATTSATATSTSTTEQAPLRRTRLQAILRRNVTSNYRRPVDSHNYRTTRNRNSNTKGPSRSTASSLSSSSSSSTATTSTISPSTFSVVDIRTTASSSTMNLTPNTSYTLNTQNLRKRLQESLLKNLIENENLQYRKPNATANLTIQTKVNRNNDKDNENILDEHANKETLLKSTTRKSLRDKNTRRTELMEIIQNPIKEMQPLMTGSSTLNTLQEIPDFDNIDDRTDLLELIEDHHSGNSLFKVLQQRNMSLEQLIEHRKRGSSQLHLATIVQNPNGLFPDKKVLLQDNLDIVTAFENFPHFNLLNLKSVKPDDIKTDSQGSSYFTSIIDIEPTDEISKGAANQNKHKLNGRNNVKALSFDILTADRNEKSLGFISPWQTIALASLAEANGKRNQTTHTPISASSASLASSPSSSALLLLPTTTKLRNYYISQPKLLLNTESNEIINDFLLNQKNNITFSNDENQNEKTYENSNEFIKEEQYNNVENTNGEYTPLQAAVRITDNTFDDIVIHDVVGQQQESEQQQQQHDLIDLELSGHGFKRSPNAFDASFNTASAGSAAGSASSASISSNIFNKQSNKKYRQIHQTNIPATIKSIIVASTTIVLIVVITLMMVFVIYRWKQQQLLNDNGMTGMSTLVRKYYAMKSKLSTTTGKPEATNIYSLSSSSLLSLNRMNEPMTMVSANTTTNTTPVTITATTTETYNNPRTTCPTKSHHYINSNNISNSNSNSCSNIYNSTDQNKSHHKSSKQRAREQSLLMLSKGQPMQSLAINMDGYHHHHHYTTKHSRSSGPITTIGTTIIKTPTEAYSSNNGSGLALITLDCHADSNFGSTTSLALSL